MSLRNYLDSLYPLEVVAASVMATTSTGSPAAGSGIDLKTCRSGVLAISYVDGTDTITGIILQDSPDDSTYTTHTTLTVSDFAKTNFIVTEIDRIKRYINIRWIKSGSTADAYWCVMFFGKEAQSKPVE